MRQSYHRSTVVAIVVLCMAIACSSIASAARTLQHQRTAHRYYVVSKGDTLWSIARRYGISLDELRRINGKERTDLLRIGERLILPSRNEQGSYVSRTSPASSPTMKVIRGSEANPPSGDPSPYFKQLHVSIGKSLVVRSKQIVSVHIANPEVADIAVLSGDAIAVVGKSVGTTTLVIVDKRGIATYDVIVQPAVRLFPERIQSAIDVPGIKVQVVDETIILSGKVPDEATKEKAITVAQLFAKNIVDLIRIEQPPEKPPTPALKPEEMQQLIGLKNVRVRQVGNVLVLEGEVESQEEMDRAQQVAQLAGATVINLLRIRAWTPDELKQLIGIPDIDIKVVRDYVVVTGTVATDEQKQAVEQLATLTGKKVLNLVQVSPPAPPTPPTPPAPPVQPQKPPEEAPKPPPPPSLADRIKEAIGIDTLHVTELGDQKVLLDGWVETTAERDRAVKIAQMFVGEGNVSDMIQVRRLQQLRVDVVVLEISRDAMKQLGVEQPSAISFGEVTREENGGRVFIRLTDITSTLRMLIERNLAKVLSAPNAIAASGKEARFTVGGEIPIPMTMLGGAAAGVETPLGTGVLAQGVEFRQYGIILTVTGTIEPNGLIQLKLQTEVSAPDFGTAVNIGGANIPGFRTRTYQTEVELKPGETIVLAGLITSEDIRQWRRIPVLSSIPIIGELFKSRSFQRRETELAIFVTPRIVETEASFEANVETARESERTRQSPNSITPSTAQKRRFEGKK